MGEIERSLPTGPRLLAQFCSFFFLPHFDPGRKQDSNQFHVFLFFQFLNIVTSYMQVWQFRFWSKWSLISYLDSGASIASSTKFLPVKRYFSFQLAKKPFNMTLICFIFLLLMNRFKKKTVVWTSHICAQMTEKPEQFRRFIDRKITIFTLGLQNADIDSPQLISKEANTFHRLKWLSHRVSCSPKWRFCTTWLTSCQESILATNCAARTYSVAESSTSNNGVVMPIYQIYIEISVGTVVRKKRCRL